jgi:hypothetical protein
LRPCRSVGTVEPVSSCSPSAILRHWEKRHWRRVAQRWRGVDVVEYQCELEGEFSPSMAMFRRRMSYPRRGPLHTKLHACPAEQWSRMYYTRALPQLGPRWPIYLYMGVSQI